MPHYPQSATGLNYITYPAGPTATGATVTADAAANTKGTYVEFVASSPFECNYVQPNVLQSSTTSAGLHFLMDIATGAALSEVVKVPNIAFTHNSNNSSHGGCFAQIPLEIPASTRIACRLQCSTGSANNIMVLTLIAAGDTPAPTSYTTFGADTATSKGVSIDPGGTINTKSGYSQISASTSAVIQIMQICLGLNTNAATAALWAVDLATGAAASEVVLIPDLRTAVANEADIANPASAWQVFLTYIAASTRIAMRASCSINNAANRLLLGSIVTAVAPSEPSGGGQRSYVG